MTGDRIGLLASGPRRRPCGRAVCDPLSTGTIKGAQSGEGRLLMLRERAGLVQVKRVLEPEQFRCTGYSICNHAPAVFPPGVALFATALFPFVLSP